MKIIFLSMVSLFLSFIRLSYASESDGFLHRTQSLELYLNKSMFIITHHSQMQAGEEGSSTALPCPPRTDRACNPTNPGSMTIGLKGTAIVSAIGDNQDFYGPTRSLFSLDSLINQNPNSPTPARLTTILSEEDNTIEKSGSLECQRVLKETQTLEINGVASIQFVRANSSDLPTFEGVCPREIGKSLSIKTLPIERSKFETRMAALTAS